MVMELILLFLIENFNKVIKDYFIFSLFVWRISLVYSKKHKHEGVPILVYLLFADNYFLFCKTNEKGVESLYAILDEIEFELTSGPRVNLQKHMQIPWSTLFGVKKEKSYLQLLEGSNLEKDPNIGHLSISQKIKENLSPTHPANLTTRVSIWKLCCTNFNPTTAYIIKNLLVLDKKNVFDTASWMASS
ncbi:hypothetical protein GYH30_019743 [Glycine max]|nr:hypothetical protein GYH30_019743 [Glycine max]